MHEAPRPDTADRDLLEVPADEHLFLPEGYQRRLEPAYFVDDVTAASGITYQPDVYSFVANLVPPAPERITHVIDIGCGRAEKLLAVHAALDGAVEIVGVDFGENLQWCRANHPQHRWIEHDLCGHEALDLGVPIETSIVVCSDVIEHLPVVEPLLRLLADIEREAVAVVVSTPDRIAARGPRDLGPPGNPSHVGEWALEELVALMRHHGMSCAQAGWTRSDDQSGHRNTSIVIGGRAFDPLRVGPVPDSFDVLAVVTAFNEADVIGDTVGRLIADGLRVHVIDNHSSDGTRGVVDEIATRHPGRVSVETWPEVPTGRYDWRALLERVEAVARESGADWIVHEDADEQRESPWLTSHGMGYRDGIWVADQFGSDGINHTVIDFPPTANTGFYGGRLEHAFRWWRFGTAVGSGVQVKAWRASAPVSLAATGGHQAVRSNVFPVRFLSRHYPIRSQDHGRRKVFRDRIARWNDEERSIGWHAQYDEIGPDHDFIEGPRTVRPFIRPEWDREFVVERLIGMAPR